MGIVGGVALLPAALNGNDATVPFALVCLVGFVLGLLLNLRSSWWEDHD
jgi:hypothetical protein